MRIRRTTRMMPRSILVRETPQKLTFFGVMLILFFIAPLLSSALNIPRCSNILSGRRVVVDRPRKSPITSRPPRASEQSDDFGDEMMEWRNLRRLNQLLAGNQKTSKDAYDEASEVSSEKWAFNKKIKDDETSQRDEWLNWLKQGVRPRGAADVVMRDDVALGGIPRSDRYSSRDWFHNALNLPQSEILRDIANPVLCVSSWATVLSVLHRLFLPRGHAIMPVTPHSLTVSALGLLLVFRTNSAYQRFVEGRKVWEAIQSTSRDLARMVKLYERDVGAERRRRVQRLLAAFPYLLRHRIRPNLVLRRLKDPDVKRDPEHSLLLYADDAGYDDDEEVGAIAEDDERETDSPRKRRPARELFWVDKRTLPWRLLPNNAMEDCARAQNRPLWLCDRISKELMSITTLEGRERLAFLAHVNALSKAIGTCERIHQTVVPLKYARHSLRSLTVWLVTLPFALVGPLGLLTGPALFVISWMLFGVYEIGYSIEDPFQGTLRLSIICDQIRRDVLDNEVIMQTAFEIDSGRGEDDDAEEGSETEDSISETQMVTAETEPSSWVDLLENTNHNGNDLNGNGVLAEISNADAVLTGSPGHGDVAHNGNSVDDKRGEVSSVTVSPSSTVVQNIVNTHKNVSIRVEEESNMTSPEFVGEVVTSSSVLP